LLLLHASATQDVTAQAMVATALPLVSVAPVTEKLPALTALEQKPAIEVCGAAVHALVENWNAEV